jgi:YebC/PmpR family DNA-binding regulatory protein
MAAQDKQSNLDEKQLNKDRQAKLFDKLTREITVAAREGGDPEANPRLRLAIERAQNTLMPEDNIEEAIKHGTGELESLGYEEHTFEGYGPGGVAMFVDSITDDKKRTTAELRDVFEKYAGSLGEDGCVAWQFERKGLIQVDADSVDDPDAFLLEVIGMGGEEMEQSTYETADDEEADVPVFSIHTAFESMHDVHDELEEAGYEILDLSQVRIATQTVDLAREQLGTYFGLHEALDAHADVQTVYSNLEYHDASLDAVVGSG